MSLAAYKRTIEETESPRQIERRLLSRITGVLERHRADFDATNDPRERLGLLAGELRDGLWKNQEMWLSLKSDLAEPDNVLPPELRAGLISLALWVERHTAGILRGSGNLDVLIVVNRSIIAGLAGQSALVES